MQTRRTLVPTCGQAGWPRPTRAGCSPWPTCAATVLTCCPRPNGKSPCCVSFTSWPGRSATRVRRIESLLRTRPTQGRRSHTAPRSPCRLRRAVQPLRDAAELGKGGMGIVYKARDTQAGPRGGSEGHAAGPGGRRRARPTAFSAKPRRWRRSATIMWSRSTTTARWTGARFVTMPLLSRGIAGNATRAKGVRCRPPRSSGSARNWPKGWPRSTTRG